MKIERITNEEEIVNWIRDLAKEEVACFNRYLFLYIPFIFGFFGLMVSNSIPDVNFSFSIKIGIGFTTIIASYQLLEIGIIKFTNTKKLFGFELFLEKLKYQKRDKRKNWGAFMSNISYTELNQTWQIVMPTIFKYLHKNSIFGKGSLKRKYSRIEPRWFNPQTKITDRVTFNSGNYLKHHFLLIMLAGIAIPVVLFIIYINLKNGNLLIETRKEYLTISCLLILFATTILWSIRINSIRRNLDYGLLSVNSSSIMWKVVAIIHYLSIMNSKKHETIDLAVIEDETIMFKENIFKIESWMKNKLAEVENKKTASNKVQNGN